MASEPSVVIVVLASAPQQPQQPQQPSQLSGKRYDFLESSTPCCGGCVAAEVHAAGKPLRRVVTQGWVRVGQE